MQGEALIQDALLSTAQWLRTIHDQVVEKMNEGKWLEDIIREMEYPQELAKKPWLQPIYDHPEFIARNVYRLYGGWYDGDPAHILPAHSDDVARELMGAVDSATILDRARKLHEDGDLQMACHLADWVKKGEPESAAHGIAAPPLTGLSLRRSRAGCLPGILAAIIARLRRAHSCSPGGTPMSHHDTSHEPAAHPGELYAVSPGRSAPRAGACTPAAGP